MGNVTDKWTIRFSGNGMHTQWGEATIRASSLPEALERFQTEIGANWEILSAEKYAR